MTSNLSHKIGYDEHRAGMVKGHDYFVHNHSYKDRTMSYRDAKIYNSLPSQEDKDFLNNEGMPQGQVYNEWTKDYYDYNQNTQTQQEWAAEHDYEIIPKGQW